ncbi:phosphoribosyltransferase [Streptomyces zhihengii]
MLERALDELAAAIAPSGEVSIVIAVANGGTIPGAGLAGRLTVPRHIHAKHNRTDAIHTQATGNVAVAFPDGFPDALSGQVLLVDDICGSGATFDAVTAALARGSRPGPASRPWPCAATRRGPGTRLGRVHRRRLGGLPLGDPARGIKLVALPAPLNGRPL